MIRGGRLYAFVLLACMLPAACARHDANANASSQADAGASTTVNIPSSIDTNTASPGGGNSDNGAAAEASGAGIWSKAAAPGDGGRSPADSGAEPTDTPASQVVTFDDLHGVAVASYIDDLSRLGVFAGSDGTFHPEQPVTRADFVRWLVLANNAIFSSDPNLQYHLADSGTAGSFTDVPSTDSNFPYIAALDSAGVPLTAGGRKLFRPDDLLTREEMLAIKEYVDRGSVDDAMKDSRDDAQLPTFRTYLPWKDASRIEPALRPAIATEYNEERLLHTGKGQADHSVDNVGRAFGAFTELHPKQVVTRAQAAACLWKFGPHANPLDSASPKARSAADALASATP